MMEGDFITLVAYVLAFRLFRQSRDWLVPVVIAVATLNREQAIFIALLHALALCVAGKPWSRRSAGVLLTDVVVWAATFFGVRAFYGFKSTQYTIQSHVKYNTDASHLFDEIMPLWTVVVAPLLLFAWLGRKRASRFEVLCALSLVPYTALFFLMGKMNELAKYLPATIILLPMALLGLGAGKEPGTSAA